MTYIIFILYMTYIIIYMSCIKYRFPFHETNKINVHYMNLKTMYIVYGMIKVHEMNIHFGENYDYTQYRCDMFIYNKHILYF